MKCPICGKRVSVWSPTINRISGDKSCPHCGAKVRFTISLGVAAATVLITVVLIFLLSVCDPSRSVGSDRPDSPICRRSYPAWR